MRLTFLSPWWRRSRSTSVDVSDDLSRDATLRELGQMLKQRRETEGLSLRELAQETRITTPVIEALERGWSDRLPERAYLASMLPQLERRLELTPGVLQPVLPPAVDRQLQMTLSQRRFTLGSIDVFTTWQGSVVYAALIGLSLLMINRQQLISLSATARASSQCAPTWQPWIRPQPCPRVILSSTLCDRWIGPGHGGHRTG